MIKVSDVFKKIETEGRLVTDISVLNRWLFSGTPLLIQSGSIVRCRDSIEIKAHLAEIIEDNPNAQIYLHKSFASVGVQYTEIVYVREAQVFISGNYYLVQQILSRITYTTKDKEAFLHYCNNNSIQILNKEVLPQNIAAQLHY